MTEDLERQKILVKKLRQMVMDSSLTKEQLDRISFKAIGSGWTDKISTRTEEELELLIIAVKEVI